MSREHSFNILLPETKKLLLSLHKGSYDCYLSGEDKSNKTLTRLEEACIMYEYSFQFDQCGYRGLEMLGVPYNDSDRKDVSLVLLEALANAVKDYVNKE